MTIDSEFSAATGSASETPRLRAAEPESTHIYLAGERKNPFNGVTGKLVKIFGLDVHNVWMLSPRAQKELRTVALLMLVIFMFDLGTWSLLFNSLAHASADIFDMSWRTIPAVVGALLVAIAVIIFERGFFTHDSDGGMTRTLLALVLRIGVIIAAALITAQPVELLAFRGPISTRRHEEQLRTEIVEKETLIAERQQEIDALVEQQRKMPEQVDTLLPELAKARNAAQARLDAAQQSSSSARAEESRASSAASRAEAHKRDAHRQLDAAEEALQRIRNRGPSADAEAYEREIQAAENTVRRRAAVLSDATASEIAANQRLDNARQAIASAQAELSVATDEARKIGIDITEQMRSLQAQRQSKEDVARLRRDDLRKYISEVRKRGMDPDGVTWPAFDKGHPPYTYKLQLGNVYEQLQIIHDLRAARPARWPAITDDQRRDIGKTYGLEDDNSPEAKARREDLAEIVRWGYWAALSIALVIPALVLATKLLLIEDLRAYYSTKRQAAAGNPYAMAVLANAQPPWSTRFAAWARRMARAVAAFRFRRTREAEL